MFFIETQNKISVQPLLWIFDLVVILNFHWEEKPDTLVVVVINQTSLCVSVINNPFQEFNAGEYRSPSHHHVQIRLSEIQEDFIVESSHIRIVVRGIFGEFLSINFLENLFPTQEYCLGPNVLFCVSKGRGLNERYLGGGFDDRHRFWRKFQLSCHRWGGTFSHLWFL